MSSASKSSLTCPKCRALVKASTSLAGQRVRCPKCGGSIKVPGVSAAKDDADDWLNLDSPTATQEPTRSVEAKTALKSTGEKPGNLDEFSAPPKEGPGDFGTTGAMDFPNLSDADLDGMQFPLTDASAAFVPPAQDLFSVADDTPEVLSNEDVIEYRFSCPVCESAHYAKPGQAGKKKKCIDCHATIDIPPPPKNGPKHSAPTPVDSTATFGLKEPVARAENPSSPFSKSAADLLKDAEDTQLDEDLDDLYANPDVAGWFRDVFGVFLDPGVMLHLMLLSVVSFIILSVAFYAADQNILAGISGGFGAAIVGGFVLGVHAYAIIQSASNDEKQVTSWPYQAPHQWIGKAFFIFTAFMITAMPGIMFGAVLLPFLAIFILFSVYLMMPFVLLSMLENSSVFKPYSQEVKASFTRCQDAWGSFYFSSGLLFVCFFLFWFVGTTIPVVAAKALILGFALTVMVFTYAKLIGRLAYGIGQGIGDAEPCS